MARPVYLLTHNHAAGDWSRLAVFFDTLPEIFHWYYFLPNTFAVTCDLSAKQLSDIVQALVGDHANFLVVRLRPEDYWGRLPGAAWPILAGHAQPPSLSNVSEAMGT